MLVSCPQCESRYKLPDEKIRATGTKVRCPRCQHAFHVFPEKPEAAPAQPQAKPPPPPPPRPEPFSSKAEGSLAKGFRSTTGKKKIKPEEPTVAPPRPPLAPPAARRPTEPVRDPRRAELAAAATVQISAPDLKGYQRDENIPNESDLSDEATQAAQNDDFVETAATMVSAPKKAPQRPRPEPEAPVEREPSPFKKKASGSSDKSYRDSDIESAERSQEEASNERERIQADLPDDGEMSEELSAPSRRDLEPDVKPFGDATFAAIQRSSTPKSNKKLIFIAGTLVVASLAYFGFQYGEQRAHTPKQEEAKKSSSSTPSTQEAVAPEAFVRPANWHRDDPSVYQDYLSQMASLPPAEQLRPDRRSLMADALVLNGMMMGIDEQVISGLGFSAALLAGNPTQVYGYYGLANYAFWKEDVASLKDLASRWPTAYQVEPEYRLMRIILDAKSGNPKAAFESSKRLMGDLPEFHRAKAWTLLLALEFWNEAQSVLSNKGVNELVKDYEKHRTNWRPSSANYLPPLYQSLDRRLARKGISLDLPKPKPQAAQKPVEATAPTESTPAPTTTTPAPSTPAAPIKAARPVKPVETKAAPKHLPKPAPNLVALNKESQKAKSNAHHLFEQASQRFKENRMDEAIALYQNALREDPDLSEAYKQLGIIYMQRKENEKALRSLKIYLQLRPDSQDRQMVEGWIGSMQ